jgi:creatinine amidohydrolase
VLLLPALSYAPAPFAQAFPGTMGISPATLTACIRNAGEILAWHGTRRLAIANAHLDPLHLSAVHRACAELADLEMRVAFPDLTRKPWALRLGDEFRSGACHAGRFETSIVLAERPELVRESRHALPANPHSISDAIRAGKGNFHDAGGPRAYFGAPAEATAEEGRALVEALGSILEEAALPLLAPEAG